MEPNDYVVNIGDIDVSTYSISGDYTASTLDISSLTDTITITTSENYEYGLKRTDIRNNGKIPIDIWARMYNNGNIDD